MLTGLGDLERTVSGCITGGEIDSALQSCSAALKTADLEEASRALRSRGVADFACAAIIEDVARNPESAQRVAELRASIGADEAPPAALERYLLLQALDSYSARMRRA